MIASCLFQTRYSSFYSTLRTSSGNGNTALFVTFCSYVFFCVAQQRTKTGNRTFNCSGVVGPRSKAQTPLIRFVVDLLYNKLYNKSTTVQEIEMSSESATNPEQFEYRWSLTHDLLWTCCTVQANYGRELT